MCAAVSEEAAASDTLVGAQRQNHVLGSWAVLEQRGGRHSHSTPAPASGGRHACGTAVPIRPERRGRGAPSAAMKWLDACEGGHHACAFATRCHSRRAVLVATWNAVVATC